MDILIIVAFIIGAAFMIHKSGKDSPLSTVAGYIVAGVTAAALGGKEIVMGWIGSGAPGAN